MTLKALSDLPAFSRLLRSESGEEIPIDIAACALAVPMAPLLDLMLAAPAHHRVPLPGVHGDALRWAARAIQDYPMGRFQPDASVPTAAALLFTDQFLGDEPMQEMVNRILTAAKQSASAQLTGKALESPQALQPQRDLVHLLLALANRKQLTPQQTEWQCLAGAQLLVHVDVVHLKSLVRDLRPLGRLQLMRVLGSCMESCLKERLFRQEGDVEALLSLIHRFGVAGPRARAYTANIFHEDADRCVPVAWLREIMTGALYQSSLPLADGTGLVWAQNAGHGSFIRRLLATLPWVRVREMTANLYIEAVADRENLEMARLLCNSAPKLWRQHLLNAWENFSSHGVVPMPAYVKAVAARISSDMEPLAPSVITFSTHVKSTHDDDIVEVINTAEEMWSSGDFEHPEAKKQLLSELANCELDGARGVIRLLGCEADEQRDALLCDDDFFLLRRQLISIDGDAAGLLQLGSRRMQTAAFARLSSAMAARIYDECDAPLLDNLLSMADEFDRRGLMKALYRIHHASVADPALGEGRRERGTPRPIQSRQAN